jgi:hypothetical protein
MEDANVELDEIYARPSSGRCFAKLRRRAGFEPSVVEDSFLKAIGKLLHVDDHERIGIWRNFLLGDRSSGIAGRKRRLAYLLFAPLGRRRQAIGEADQVLESVSGSPELRREIGDLLDILADRIRTVSQMLDSASDVPLASRATYTLGDIVAAHEHTDNRCALVFPQGRVLWSKETQTDLLFVTLEKSDRDYSPTTRYADYPISPTLFHWEAQNTKSPDTPTGHRYIKQPARGTNVVLFVRERKRDGRGETLPYHCIGRARYRSHESERPTKILWELERPMPGWLYQAAKVVAG